MRIHSVLLSCCLLSVCTPARAQGLYEFVAECKSAPLGACFGRIEMELEKARDGGEGRSFCIPRVWGANLIPSTSYPVSMLDYMLLRLAAARIGRAGEPVQAVLRDTLAELFPCGLAGRGS